jgi:hypothetical protein
MAGFFYEYDFLAIFVLEKIMRKVLFLSSLLMLAAGAVGQVIKKGNGKNIYVRVDDTASVKPFRFVKQNMFTLSIYDMMFTNVSANYEFFTSDGKMGYQLPISINAGGLPDSSQYEVRNTGRFLAQRNRIFQTGFSVNHYPNGQDRVSYYVGFNVLAGWFYYWRYTYSPPPVYYVSSERLIGTNLSGTLHGGLLFNPRETIVLNMRAGFGLRRNTTIYREYTFPFMQIDFCLGFKF